MSKKEEILHKLNTEDRNYIKKKFKEREEFCIGQVESLTNLINVLIEENKELNDEKFDLERKLTEKEEEIEELKQTKLLDDLHYATLTLLIGDKTRADLWALVEEHAMRELVLEERIKQEKNQTAINELERVKETAKDVYLNNGGILHLIDIKEIVDQQITEIKERN